jgi:hypothetical protein
MSEDHYKDTYGLSTITKPPKPVGSWVMYPQGAWKTKFMVYHKPTDEQIKNTEQLLGWGWEDAT